MQEVGQSNLLEIFPHLPGRKRQVSLLLTLLGADNEVPCEAIFLYGDSGTGKSLVMQTLVKHLSLQFSWVNCLEAYSPRVLYHLILKGFPTLFTDGNYNCANFYSFCASLKELVSEKLDNSRPTCIILENSDRLYQPDFNVIPSLLRLQEFTRMSICLIFISELTWQKLIFNNGLCDPVVVHFPEYTSEELIEILRLHRPSDCSWEFYDGYVRLLLKILCPVTRSTREILHMAKLNFAEYRRPVETGEITETDTVKLWRNIEPHLKNALSKIYLRTMWANNYKARSMEPVISTQPLLIAKGMELALCELPFYSKFLLISAYLASYNPPKTDCKFFIKYQGKSSKKKSSTLFKTQKQNRHVEGPKSFNLDRLLAIFHSIVEDRVIPSALLTSQITSLVSLRMLACLTSKEPLTNPKYKCLVSLESIRGVARTVNFDVVRYLEDFA